MPSLLSYLTTALAFAATSTYAFDASLFKRQHITALSWPQIQAFNPFTHFASAAYCQPHTTLAWSCGANCKANPDFIPVASGGDGSDTQFWFVGFSPSLESVIVSHQGTDPTQMEAIATDGEVYQEHLNHGLFPGVDPSVMVHSGFANEQAKTAVHVLDAVNQAVSIHNAKSVKIVGHSLGAAIALLDAVYLPLHLTGIEFEMIGYGMPRVGNQAFANYVDAHIQVTHINNKKDPVPIIPGRFLGYHHPSGEVHISDTEIWYNCPGQDNPSNKCSTGEVPNIIEGNTTDHDGPYNGILMGC